MKGKRIGFRTLRDLEQGNLSPGEKHLTKSRSSAASSMGQIRPHKYPSHALARCKVARARLRRWSSLKLRELLKPSHDLAK